MANQRVDEGGLAGAGGSPDDGEERGVQAAVPRKDVVIQLAHCVGRVKAGLVGPGQGQGQIQARETVPHILQQAHRFRGLVRLVGAVVLVPGDHRNIMPAQGAGCRAEPGLGAWRSDQVPVWRPVT
jgi:hypothetical protein